MAAIDKLDYIKGLGVNTIHVMPVSEFEGTVAGVITQIFFCSDKAYGTATDLKHL